MNINSNYTKDQIRSKEDQAAFDEYFANGGKVTVCETGARTEDLVVNPWKKSKKKDKKS